MIIYKPVSKKPKAVHHLSDIPENVILVFEADGNWNLAGGPELLKTRRSEHGYVAMFFADGTTGNYWFYTNSVRKFSPKGTHMYYEKPRWKP